MELSLQKNILDFFEQNTCALEVSQEHLAECPLCDFSDSSIQTLKKNLLGNLTEPEKIANKVYDYLRSHIYYEFDLWPVSASETEKKKAGMCFNKSNLMVALLRSCKIPALYSFFWIGKNGFKFTSDPVMFDKIQSRTVHAYVEVYLDKRKSWRRYVDTSLDFPLRKVLQKQGYNPFENILTDLPIERFSSPEAVLDWRKKYKESVGAIDVITKEEMELSNQKIRELRKEDPKPSPS